MNNFSEIALRQGEILFEIDAPADKLYFIQSGEIGMTDKTGKVFATLSTGESFGEQAMLQGGLRGATAIALRDSVCQEITVDGLRDMLKHKSPVMIAVFEGLMLQQHMHNALKLTPL